MNIKNLLIKLGVTKTKFKAWLESQKPNKVVGYVGSDSDCPLANYTKTLWFKTTLTIEIPDQPKWMQVFVTKVDSLKTKTVSAKKALELLCK
jgi:hypothetical protein